MLCYVLCLCYNNSLIPYVLCTIRMINVAIFRLLETSSLFKSIMWSNYRLTNIINITERLFTCNEI